MTGARLLTFGLFSRAETAPIGAAQWTNVEAENLRGNIDAEDDEAGVEQELHPNASLRSSDEQIKAR